MNRAILIITGRTRNNPDFRDVPGVEGDAMEVHAFFKHAGYNFVRLLRDASKHEIELALRAIIDELTYGDPLVIYFAGHGHLVNGHNLLLCHGARLNTLPHFKEALPVDYLRVETDDRGLHRMLILDCCRNSLYQTPVRGEAEGLRGAEQLRDIGNAPVGNAGGSFHVLWGCSQGQVAPEIPLLSRGLFTTAMISVFEDWAARHGEVAMTDEVFAAVGQRMEELTRDHNLPYTANPDRSGNGPPPVILRRARPNGAPLEPAAKPGLMSLVVSADGSTRYASINQAIAAAAPGAMIRLRPGVYREAVVLNKDVEIVGSGPRDQVVIECDNDDCIRMATGSATVRGVAIRCTSKAIITSFSGVDAGVGQLTLEDCDVTSTSSSCVWVEGKDTLAVIRRCRIHNGASLGITFDAGATGIVEDCDIAGHRLACVVMSEGGDPILRRCKIHDGKFHGVQVEDQGKGTLEDCDIFGFWFTCVVIQTLSDPVLRRCKIHNGRCGVSVMSNGKGTLEDCDVFGHSEQCVRTATEGHPTLRRCTIHDGSGDGVCAEEDEGKGTFEDCEIFGHAKSCLVIRAGGDPVLRRCKIHGSPGRGVYVEDQGRGTLEDCDISGSLLPTGHALPCVAIKNGGDLVLRRCKIHNGNSTGVYAFAGGKGTLDNCDIFSHAYPCVMINTSGDLILRRCKIHGSQSNGVVVEMKGKGTIADCLVYDNAGSNFNFAPGCEVKLSGNKESP